MTEDAIYYWHKLWRALHKVELRLMGTPEAQAKLKEMNEQDERERPKRVKEMRELALKEKLQNEQLKGEDYDHDHK